MSHEFVRVISTSAGFFHELRVDEIDLYTQNDDSRVDGEISHCFIANDSSIVIGVGSHIILLSINAESGSITVSEKHNARDHISSLAISLNKYLVFSTWSTPPSVTFLQISDFEIVEKLAIPSTSQNLIHGLFSQKFESSKDDYVFVSMGDGDLFYFTISSLPNFKISSSIKKTNLGSQPATFHSFLNNHQTNVLACSDRPTILYHRASKLLFSSVNLKNVVGIASLSNDDESLVVVTDEDVLIGEMEAVQKLHVKSIQVGETCRRIVEWGEEWYGVITVSQKVIEDEKKEDNFVCLFDSVTFKGKSMSIF